MITSLRTIRFYRCRTAPLTRPSPHTLLTSKSSIPSFRVQKRSISTKTEPNMHFVSDNTSGMHPDILQSIVECNAGDYASYGADSLASEVDTLIRKEIGPNAKLFYCFGGTGANVVGLSSVMHAYSSVICSDWAHLHLDECGAPERFIGCKVLAGASAHGKLSLDTIEALLGGVGDQHHAQPRVLSVALSTEYGTVYSMDELDALRALADRHSILLHMDGARIANAAVALNVELGELCAPFDLVSFGGTKNGMMCGEAVLFPNADKSPEIRDAVQSIQYHRKQAMQLPSKTRFISAQFIAYLSDRLWHRNARNANEMAAYLSDQLVTRMPQHCRLTHPVQANSVFVTYPSAAHAQCQRHFEFYMWDATVQEVRLMCAFDTRKEQVDELVKCMQKCVEEAIRDCV